jgi:hypothetical protein
MPQPLDRITAVQFQSGKLLLPRIPAAEYFLIQIDANIPGRWPFAPHDGAVAEARRNENLVRWNLVDQPLGNACPIFAAWPHARFLHLVASHISAAMSRLLRANWTQNPVTLAVLRVRVPPLVLR